MKILIADSVDESVVGILKADPAWTVVNLPKTKGRVEDEIRDADALLVRSATKVTAELLEKAKSLRVIGRAGVGVDNVVLDAATRRGVLVLNTPGGNAISVAEHTLALMLSMARSIPAASASVREGRWEKKKFMGRELRGKTLGIAGLGRIGMEVARRARAMEMQVIAYDPYVSPVVARDSAYQMVSFDELCARADYLTLHVSLTAETEHMINVPSLRK